MTVKGSGLSTLIGARKVAVEAEVAEKEAANARQADAHAEWEAKILVIQEVLADLEAARAKAASTREAAEAELREVRAKIEEEEALRTAWLADVEGKVFWVVSW